VLVVLNLKKKKTHSTPGYYDNPYDDSSSDINMVPQEGTRGYSMIKPTNVYDVVPQGEYANAEPIAPSDATSRVVYEEFPPDESTTAVNYEILKPDSDTINN